MVTNLSHKDCDFEWIDVIDPHADELSQLGKKFGLHEALVHDCLQPGHLPKYEQMKDYTFIIIRVYFPENDIEADSVQEITNKIAIFFSEKYIITIHRKPWAPIQQIATTYFSQGECHTSRMLLCKIVKAGLLTYDEPAAKLTRTIEVFERKIFLTERQLSIIKTLYYVKRKLDVVRRLLILTYDIVDFVDE